VPDTRFPQTLEDGTAYVSPSQVKSINGCGARYEWKYVMGNEHPSGEALHVGRLTHELIEAWALDTPAADDPVRHALQYVDDEIPEHVVEASEMNGFQFAHEGLRLLTVFEDHVDEQEWRVITAEEEIVNKAETPAFHGYLDLLVETPDGELLVVDTKTTSRSPSYGRALERDVYQVVRYAEAKREQGIPVDAARVVYLVRNKTAKVVDAPVELSAEAVAWARSVHEGGVEKIRRGDYEPNPFGAGFLCAPDKCGRWDSCPGAARWRKDDGGEG